MVIALEAYLIILLALGAERIVELFIARRNAERAIAAGAIEVGQRHYRAMVIFHTAFLIACGVERLMRGHGAAPAIALIAVTAEILAQALRYWVIATLGPRWNTRIIVLPGAQPVTRGPYRFARHPNYVAVAIEMLAVPMIGGAWITAIVFSIGNAILMLVRIPAEERALGNSYAGAFGSLPRFIPRLRHG
ncbi:MAG TPA: isoprenylcysteine carboxylmethyltransferase family protein [Candidatus Binataceae bacterium]|nr:isoprenylcysteine carboxylmethyltransferase family protein [Candidatus Binataceae bacterium]